eukprot:1158575-Pelagomonas_calceolata.AAC.1
MHSLLTHTHTPVCCVLPALPPPGPHASAEPPPLPASQPPASVQLPAAARTPAARQQAHRRQSTSCESPH